MPKTQRAWGYVRAVQDSLWSVPRANIEICQPAFFGVPPGAQTSRIQKRTARKRERERREEARGKRQRMEEEMRRVAREATIDTWEQLRYEEERAREEERIRREQEHASVEGEDQGDLEGQTVPEDRSAIDLNGH